MLTRLKNGPPLRNSEGGTGWNIVESHHGTGGGLDGGHVSLGLGEGRAEGGSVCHGGRYVVDECDVICDVGGGVAVVSFQYNTNMVLWRGQSPCGGGRIGEVSSEFPLDSFVGGNKVSNNFSILYNILTSS